MSGPLQAERVRSLRPWFLMAAMILIWLVGVRGVHSGCQQALIINSGSMPDEVAALESARGRTDSSAYQDYSNAVYMRALVENKGRTLPLAIAQGILSLLLVVASAMVLSGRTGARSFALQVFGAHAVFYLADYGLTQDFRDQWVGALARANLPVGDPASPGYLSSRVYYWLLRGAVAFHVLVSAAGILALLSKRTQVFFEAAERAEQRREREDEP